MYCRAFSPVMHCAPGIPLFVLMLHTDTHTNTGTDTDVRFDGHTEMVWMMCLWCYCVAGLRGDYGNIYCYYYYIIIIILRPVKM